MSASSGNGQVGVGINGRWRYAAADVTSAVFSGAAGTYPVYVTASDNAFTNTPTFDTDNTTYTFGLEVRTAGNPATALYRQVGWAKWDGTAFVAVFPFTSTPLYLSGDTDLYRAAAGVLRTSGALQAAGRVDAGDTTAGQVRSGAVGPASQAGILLGSGLDTNLYRSAADTLKTDDAFQAASFAVGTTPLASTHLSDTAALARLASPTFTGVPAAPTPSAGDNTTKVATTAFVSNFGRICQIGMWAVNEQIAANASGGSSGAITFTAYGRQIYAMVFGGYRLENGAGGGALFGLQYSFDGGTWTAMNGVSAVHLTGAMNGAINLGAVSAGTHTLAFRYYQGNTPYGVNIEGSTTAIILESA